MKNIRTQQKTKLLGNILFLVNDREMDEMKKIKGEEFTKGYVFAITDSIMVINDFYRDKLIIQEDSQTGEGKINSSIGNDEEDDLGVREF